LKGRKILPPTNMTEKFPKTEKEEKITIKNN